VELILLSQNNKPGPNRKHFRVKVFTFIQQKQNDDDDDDDDRTPTCDRQSRRDRRTQDDSIDAHGNVR